jgi:hypothetical protein
MRAELARAFGRCASSDRAAGRGGECARSSARLGADHARRVGVASDRRPPDGSPVEHLDLERARRRAVVRADPTSGARCGAAGSWRCARRDAGRHHGGTMRSRKARRLPSPACGEVESATADRVRAPEGEIPSPVGCADSASPAPRERQRGSPHDLVAGEELAALDVGVSALSEPWTVFSPTDSANCLRMVPSAAFAGFVAPMTSRYLAMACRPRGPADPRAGGHELDELAEERRSCARRRRSRRARGSCARASAPRCAGPPSRSRHSRRP